MSSRKHFDRDEHSRLGPACKCSENALCILDRVKSFHGTWLLPRGWTLLLSQLDRKIQGRCCQVLCCKYYTCPKLPAFSQYSIQGPESRKRSGRPRWLSQAHRFRLIQNYADETWPKLELQRPNRQSVWHSRVFSAWAIARWRIQLGIWILVFWLPSLWNVSGCSPFPRRWLRSRHILELIPAKG